MASTFCDAARIATPVKVRRKKRISPPPISTLVSTVTMSCMFTPRPPTAKTCSPQRSQMRLMFVDTPALKSRTAAYCRVISQPMVMIDLLSADA